MLTAIRELAEEAEAGGDLAAVVARGDDCVAADARDARRSSPRRASSTRAPPGSSRSSAGSPACSPASRCPSGSSPPARRRPSTSLHQRALRSTATARRSCVEGERLDADELERELEPLGDSLLVVGDPTRAEGPRPHRRSRPGALARRRARDDRERRDREHARADARARAAAAAGGARRADDLRCALVAVAVGSGQPRALREPRRRRSSTAAGR